MPSDINNLDQTIVLLRHAKAIKNEQNRHGGCGTDLVENAINEIIMVGNQFLRFNAKFERILYSPRKQCEQTAKILGRHLNVNSIELQELEPINLGIVDGLSEQEVKSRYPEIDIQLGKWRSGEIEINQLIIPQMTNCHTFFNNGAMFISNVIAEGKSTIIVASRSILILLVNVLLGRNSQFGGNYREIKWENSEFAVFNNKEFNFDASTLRIQ
jgi:broad specificity phosphatase PhoE